MSFENKKNLKLREMIQEWAEFAQRLKVNDEFTCLSFTTGLSLRIAIDAEFAMVSELAQDKLAPKIYRIDSVFYGNTQQLSKCLIDTKEVRVLMLYCRAPKRVTDDFKEVLVSKNIQVSDNFDYLQDLYSQPKSPKAIDRSYEY